MSKLRAALIGFGLGIALVAGTAATVLAADKGGPRRVEADIVAPTSKSWSGPWIGLNVGYAVGTSQVKGEMGQPFSFDSAADGVTYGLGAGFDYQMDRVVVGVMVDYDRTNAKNKFSVPVNQSTFLIGDIEVDSMWFAGARAGFLVTPHVLAYGLAGYTKVSVSSSLPAGAIAPDSGGGKDPGGVTLGGGLEVMAQAGWSLKMEYRFTDLGNDTLRWNGIPAILPPSTAAVDQNMHQVRLGVSYRF